MNAVFSKNCTPFAIVSLPLLRKMLYTVYFDYKHGF